MVDSRQKGARAENDAKKILIKYTGLNWQRIPMSGALDEKHGLKGDLYIPGEKQTYCVEVKHYKDDHLTSKILTTKTKPQLIKWWEQAEREAGQVDREPLLLFKFDRSKWFVATHKYPDFTDFIFINSNGYELFCMMLEEWLSKEMPHFKE